MDGKQTVPYLVECDKTQGPADLLEAEAWLRSRRHSVQDDLLRQGAILFRGFPVRTRADFARIARALGDDLKPYIGGGKARVASAFEGDESFVYSAAAVPAYVKTHLHCEMAYQKSMPSQIVLFCEKAAAVGGESLLGDAHRIYEALDPRVREEFSRRGLLFERCLPRGAAWIKHASRYTRLLNVVTTWESNFGTSDQSEVERLASDIFDEFRWTPAGDFVARTRVEASRPHPRSGLPVWSNSAHLFQLNARVFGPVMYPLMRAFLSFSARPKSLCYFGDGEPIPSWMINAVLDALEGQEVAVALEPGDFMLIDNFRVMHGRRTYRGERRLWFAQYQ